MQPRIEFINAFRLQVLPSSHLAESIQTTIQHQVMLTCALRHIQHINLVIHPVKERFILRVLLPVNIRHPLLDVSHINSLIILYTPCYRAVNLINHNVQPFIQCPFITSVNNFAKTKLTPAHVYVRINIIRLTLMSHPHFKRTLTPGLSTAAMIKHNLSVHNSIIILSSWLSPPISPWGKFWQKIYRKSGKNG